MKSGLTCLLDLGLSRLYLTSNAEEVENCSLGSWPSDISFIQNHPRLKNLNIFFPIFYLEVGPRL